MVCELSTPQTMTKPSYLTVPSCGLPVEITCMWAQLSPLQWEQLEGRTASCPSTVSRTLGNAQCPVIALVKPHQHNKQNITIWGNRRPGVQFIPLSVKVLKYQVHSKGLIRPGAGRGQEGNLCWVLRRRTKHKKPFLLPPRLKQA